MAKFLANENVPRPAIDAVRRAGLDVSWVKEWSAGADDEAVMAKALAEGRVLVTFDKDFGELVFRRGQDASRGVVLMRPRLRSPDYVSDFVVEVLSQEVSWEGHFCVAREGRLRVVALPKLQ